MNASEAIQLLTEWANQTDEWRSLEDDGFDPHKAAVAVLAELDRQVHQNLTLDITAIAALASTHLDALLASREEIIIELAQELKRERYAKALLLATWQEDIDNLKGARSVRDRQHRQVLIGCATELETMNDGIAR